MAKKKFWHDPTFSTLVLVLIVLLIILGGAFVIRKKVSSKVKKIEPLPVVFCEVAVKKNGLT